MYTEYFRLERCTFVDDSRPLYVLPYQKPMVGGATSILSLIVLRTHVFYGPVMIKVSIIFMIIMQFKN